MTKQEAAEILGIPVTATAEEVRRRYQEVFSDFQIRLTNAPTAQLRKTYQEACGTSSWRARCWRRG
ncbi:MAG: hypothetical protein IPN03_21095 [Holophagales bacterium]|nr:hypothetical protein [Holophagales bacterium]